MAAATRFEDTLRSREIHPDDWYWISPEERDALADAIEALRAFVENGEITENGVLMRDIGAATDCQITLARLDGRLDGA